MNQPRPEAEHEWPEAELLRFARAAIQETRGPGHGLLDEESLERRILGQLKRFVSRRTKKRLPITLKILFDRAVAGVVNANKDAARKERHRRELLHKRASYGASAQKRDTAAYLESVFGELLRRLSEEQQQALRLRFVNDYTQDRIAEVMGVSRDQVQAILLSATLTLQGDVLSRQRSDPLFADALRARDVGEQVKPAKGRRNRASHSDDSKSTRE